MKGYFVFDELNSKDYFMFAANKNFFDGGGKVIETIKIPGRNGTLSIADGTFENLTITYEMYCKGDIMQNLPALRNRLAATSGYCRLTDNFEPDIFMRARYIEPFTAKSYDKTKAALDVSFDCDPRRFLKSGEEEIELTASASIMNPSHFEALPLLRVYGTGTITIGSVPVTINSANTYTDIDCELQEA